MIHKRSILLLVLLATLALTGLMCTIPGLEGESNNDPDLTATLAAIQITQTSLAAAPTITPTSAVTDPPTPTATIAPTEDDGAQVGSISGQLSFPSEGIPALRVIAYNQTSGFYHYIETTPNQGVYTINDLPAGTYQVVAYVLDGSFAGGYSQAVPCGLAVGCDDHSLINVEVAAAQDSPNIDPADWYAPDGAFPPDPISASQTGSETFGSISGSLSFPSEMIPPLQVVAFSLQGGQYYYVLTVANQAYYTIENLPPGNYQVVAYVLDGSLGGGYTSAVLCGLSVDCTDHSLLSVQVESGKDTTGVDPGDWYAPDGSFPPKPAS